MKKLSLILLTISFVAGLQVTTACGDDGEDTPVLPSGAVSVTVVPETLVSGPEAGVVELKVKADADWAIRSDADWITIRPTGGLKNTETTVQISHKANDSMDERSTTIDIVSGGKIIRTVTLTQNYVAKAITSLQSVIAGGQESNVIVTISANAEWTLSCTADWLTFTPAKGNKGETPVELKIKANDSSESRECIISLVCGQSVSEIKVCQMSDEVTTPEGYTLIWSDEFNEGTAPGSDWVLENWPAGYVNNELQTYTSRPVDGKSTVEIRDGFLNINCFKGSDGKIYSGRMNARPSTGWLYGYFEARIMLPSGKGTWPAFWMMPCNVDWNTNGWPKCGEIDIMEEVGANADYVSSSLHTEKYNHTKGTQKTHEMKCQGAEGSFHVYALEWTEDAITTYVDGKVQLHVTKAEMGTDHDSWPFHYAFYPILNLAWGGDWGGYKGIDESALPVTMKVDYVRVFQKK